MTKEQEEIFRFEVKDDTDDELVGRFNYTNRPNNNGWIFTEEAMSKALAEGFLLRSEMTYGHLGSDRIDCTETDLSRVSHVLKQIYEEEDGYGVRVKILDTPNGRKLKDLIDSGADLQYNGVYTGTIGKGGVIENLEFVTVDIIPVKREEDEADRIISILL